MQREAETNRQSIQVTVRVRPPSDRQLNEDPRVCVRVDREDQSLMLQTGPNGQAKTFRFDSICDGSDTQQDIYLKVGVGSTDRCLEGYNCCIFAYGQTGAGKTFTMMGVNHEDSSYYQKRGVIPRTLEYLFQRIDKEIADFRSQYLVKCTFLEIYNEQIIDLLNKGNVNLQLRQDLKKGVYVEGITEETVGRSDDAMEILRRGSKGRHVGSTCYNETSSRSHSVFSMLLESKNTHNGIVHLKSRRFHFIDLAGSQRTKQSNGQRLRQGCSINKSLHVLGMVINSLVESTEGKARHINYRDSKLTFLLKDALGGNSKTHLIANISPNWISCQETLSTLTFARRVKLIKLNKVSINEDSSGNLESMKAEIRRLKQEIVQLKSYHSQSQDSIVEELVGVLPQVKEMQQVLSKNQSKLGLEKILQDYIEESIEKDTKFELELAKRDQRLGLLDQALSQYSKNEVHLRMIINLYEEKFKRLKNLEDKLTKRMDELTATEKEQVLTHLGVQKQLLTRQLQQYKELLCQTPFIMSMMKGVSLISDDKPEETVAAQLSSNLAFLKQLKNQLEQTVRERQQLNTLIQNFSINREQQMSPKKRKAIEKQYELKEQQYKDKLQQMELQQAFLKGTAEETEQLLKESVDRQLTLEEKIAQKDKRLRELESQIKNVEEREQQTMMILIKEKEEKERELEIKATAMSMEHLELKQIIKEKNDQVDEKDSKIKKHEQTIQELIKDNAEMQLRNDFMEKTVRDTEIQAANDRQNLTCREETIIRLSTSLDQVKAQRDQAMQQLEVEKHAKRVMREDLEAEREVLLTRHHRKVQQLSQELDIIKTKESENHRRLNEATSQLQFRGQRLSNWENKYNNICQQLEVERQQLKKRQEELRELFVTKADNDSQLKTQVNALSLQLISKSEEIKKFQQIWTEASEKSTIMAQKIQNLEKQLENRCQQLQSTYDNIEQTRQKDKVNQKHRQQLQIQIESLKSSLRQEQQKNRQLLIETDRIHLKEKEQQNTISNLQQQLESAEHRNKQSMNMGNKLSEQLRELSQQFERKEKLNERMRQSHQKSLNQLNEQLENQKEKSQQHENYMKKVFEECTANKDKIINDLRTQNGQLQQQTSEDQQLKIKIKQYEQKNKELVEIVNQKDASIMHVNQQILLLKDEIEHMRNIYEQKIEEREQVFSEMADRKHEQLQKAHEQIKKLQLVVDNQESIIKELKKKCLQSAQRQQYILELQQEINIANKNLQESKAQEQKNKDEAIRIKLISNEQLNQLEEELLRERQSRGSLAHDFNHTIGKLNAQLTSQQSKFEAIQGRLGKRVTQLEEALSKSDVNLKNLIDSSSTSSFKIAELEDRLANSNMELETIQSQFNESEVRVRELTDMLQQKELTLVKSKNGFNHRIRQLQFELQNTQKCLDEELKLKEASRGTDNQKERVFNERVESLKIDNEQLRSNLGQLYNQISELQATVNKLQVREINLAKCNAQLESEKRQMNSRFNVMSEEIREKTNLLQTLSKEKQKTDQLAESVQQLKDKLYKQTKQMEAMEVRLNNEKFDELRKIKEDFLTELHKTNNMNDHLSRQNSRLKEDSQKIIGNLQKQKSHLLKENEEMRQEVMQSERDQDSRRGIKQQQLTQYVAELEEALKLERNNCNNLKKLIDNIERQKVQLQAEIEEKDESHKRVLAKMALTRVENPRPSEERKKTNELLQRSRMQLLEYKQVQLQSRKIVEENSKLVKRLKSEMQAKEDNFIQMHEKAEEFCRNQELKVSSIRADYEKLQNEHQLLLRQKQRLEGLQDQNQNLQQEIASYKAYQVKADKKLQQLQNMVHSLNNEMMELREELQGYRRQPMRVGTESGSDAKMQYINKIKEENSLLKRQKQILSDRLNQQTEEKLRLKTHLNQFEKKQGRDAQNRSSLHLLDNMGNNIEVQLKIELERRIAEIKYLQEGYAELCLILGAKKVESRHKGETTVSVIMSMVRDLIQELSEVKTRLKDKQKEFDSKSMTYDIINKEYNHLKSKILQAKGVKDREDSYNRKPRTENTFASIKNTFEDSYKQEFDQRNRDGSRSRKIF